ncbi:MAG: DEAD/DEAH box helicase [Chloroflexi bacterium]|nr:MAG: DEAD/DEAH box helicase [Chloroflexota bacterium]
MNNTLLQTTLKDLNIPFFIQQADHATLARMIASSQTDDTNQHTPEKLPRYGFIYEKQGIRVFKQLMAKQKNVNKNDMLEHFQKAFICWRALVSLPEEPHKPLNGHISTTGIRFVEKEFQDELLPAHLTLAFRLGVSGLLAELTAEARLDLKKFQFSPQENLQANWRSIVVEYIFSAFVLLVRKDKGWEDIHQALTSINRLRQFQDNYEEHYLESIEESEEQTLAALELIGLYHLAQLITLVGEYLQTGEPGNDKVNLRLDRHHEQATATFEETKQPLLAHLADLLWAGCRELVQNAIWTHVSRLGENAQKYVQLLTASAREQPVLELWPSQQEAFRRHLLDSYQRAILVEMPTSAGKTLLAKFAVIQTKALNPNSVIAYVVPTRALVNQVTLDFRMDFRQIMQVEQTIPVFELDPTEERLLKNNVDILVTTPEKLDLLIRSEHPVTKKISLVVADEAHNIGEGDRGARLELLLGTIKRDRPRARFLLLSPFLPNGQELVQWLGDDQALPPISIDWKPSRKLVGSVQSTKSQGQWTLEFETLPTAHVMDIRPFMKINVGQISARITSIEALTEATVQALSKRGTLLILCHGPGTSVTRAKQITTNWRQNLVSIAILHNVYAME